MDGDGEWRQVKVCQCPGSGERESRAVCRDIAQIDEETNIGNNTQAGERTERDIAPGLHKNQNSLHFFLIYIIQENGTKPKETNDFAIAIWFTLSLKKQRSVLM